MQRLLIRIMATFSMDSTQKQKQSIHKCIKEGGVYELECQNAGGESNLNKSSTILTMLLKGLQDSTSQRSTEGISLR